MSFIFSFNSIDRHGLKSDEPTISSHSPRVPSLLTVHQYDHPKHAVVNIMLYLGWVATARLNRTPDAEAHY
jgi:hypothetical protein